MQERNKTTFNGTSDDWNIVIEFGNSCNLCTGGVKANEVRFYFQMWNFVFWKCFSLSLFGSLFPSYCERRFGIMY